MSRNKRFQQIEPPEPDENKKTSLLGKLFFKRRIEIAGKTREALPEMPSPPPPAKETPKTEERIEIEHRVPLENLSKKIEESDQQKQRKQAEALREIDIIYAKSRTEEAKTRVWTTGLLLVLLVPALFFMLRNRDSFGRDFLFIVITLVLSYLRSQRRGW